MKNYAKPKQHQSVNFWGNGKKAKQEADGTDERHLTDVGKIEQRLHKIELEKIASKDDYWFEGIE